MSALATPPKSPALHSAHLAFSATLLCLACASSLHAQTASPQAPSATDQQVLPDIGAPSGLTGATTPSGLQPDASPYTHTDTSQDPGPSHHARSNAAAPFRIPHSITKTTASGTKFQFTLPRVGFRAGNGQVGRVSPLDSNDTQFAGARGNSMFPADNSFLQPNDPSSDNMFGSSSDDFADTPTGGHRGTGGAGRGGAGGAGGGGAGGPGLNVKSSTFDFHVGLSMKEMMAGSFSQNGSQNGGGSSSSGFSMSGSSANDFSTGGNHTPGSEGRGGAGAKLSLGLRF